MTRRDVEGTWPVGWAKAQAEPVWFRMDHACFPAVSAWCHAIKNGLQLRSDGDGTQSRDMCYVDNVVSANILAANYSGENLKGRCYNIACGGRVSNNEILNYLKSKFFYHS